MLHGTRNKSVKIAKKLSWPMRAFGGGASSDDQVSHIKADIGKVPEPIIAYGLEQIRASVDLRSGLFRIPPRIHNSPQNANKASARNERAHSIEQIATNVDVDSLPVCRRRRHHQNKKNQEIGCLLHEWRFGSLPLSPCVFEWLKARSLSLSLAPFPPCTQSLSCTHKAPRPFPFLSLVHLSRIKS